MYKFRPMLVAGRPFDLDTHTYLRGIYADDSKEVVYLKAAQVGVSEYLISWVLYMAAERRATGFYIMPTDTHVSDFSAARLGPAIDPNVSPLLSALIMSGSGSKRGADKVMLKRVGDRFVYFRGGQITETSSGGGVRRQHSAQLRSVDADTLVLDELDELDPRVPSIARARLEHSDIAKIRIASTPTFSDQGIFLAYRASDQRLWFVPCPSCGERQPLELGNLVLEWDALERPLRWNGQEAGEPYLGCRKCGAKLNRAADGEWVPTYPDRPVHGYHIIGLASPRKSLADILTGLQSVNDTVRQQTYNQGLGLAYKPRDAESLSEPVLNSCIRDYALGPVKDEPCYAGIDVGRVLNFVIRGKSPDGNRPLRYAGQIESFDEVIHVLSQYKLQALVIDALPETRKARELQKRFPRLQVWLAYFNRVVDGVKTETPAKWNPKDLEVDVDRTRALDGTLAAFHNAALKDQDGNPLPGNTLPANARNLRDYYSQMMAPLRVIREDRRGVQVPSYVANSADHYAFAEAYCYVAGLCPYQAWSRGNG